MLLSKEQKQATTHVTGPMLVLAGPGSGKTAVITMRVKYLIEKEKVSPHQILVITYTRAAALEMRERFFGMCPKGAGVTFATFHSFFFRILRENCPFETSDLITDRSRREIVKRSVETVLPGFVPSRETIDSISRDIALYKNLYLDPESFAPSSCGTAEFNGILSEYNKRLRANGNIDFDDILSLAYGLLKKDRKVRGELSDTFRYILIDEFQDINRLQYETIRLLESKDRNVFAVGDDDQAIYSFRGADPRLMDRFLADHPEAPLAELCENHRCPKCVVEHSSRLIKNNSVRFQKKLFSSKDEGSVTIRVFNKTSDEYSFVAEAVSRAVRKGTDPSSIAVLYRSNYQPGPLVSLFSTNNIPFDVKGGRGDIYESLPGRIVLSYLAASKGEIPRDAALTIINVPERGIPRGFFSRPRVNLLCPPAQETYGETKEALLSLAEDLKVMSKLDPFSCIKYIRKKIGLDRYIKEFEAAHASAGVELLPILDALEEEARVFSSYADWCESISIKRSGTNGSVDDSKGVRFLSFHSAKGLEFDTVFIIDAAEGIVPSPHALITDSIEEERRMFYVALTRASRDLYVLYAKEHCGRTAAPSRFIAEMSD